MSATTMASHLHEGRTPYTSLRHGITVYAYDTLTVLPPGHEPQMDEMFQPLDDALFAFDPPASIDHDPQVQALYEHLVDGITDEYTIDPKNPAHHEPRWYTLGYQTGRFSINHFAHGMYLSALQKQLWPKGARAGDPSLPFAALIAVADTPAIMGPVACARLYADFLAHPHLEETRFHKDDLVHQRWVKLLEQVLITPSMSLVLTSN